MLIYRVDTVVVSVGCLSRVSRWFVEGKTDKSYVRMEYNTDYIVVSNTVHTHNLLFSPLPLLLSSLLECFFNSRPSHKFVQSQSLYFTNFSTLQFLYCLHSSWSILRFACIVMCFVVVICKAIS